MRRFFILLALCFTASAPAHAAMKGETHLLALCDEFGETKAECKCYFGEVKDIYPPADIALSGSAAKAFLAGKSPETIVSYLLLTRKISIPQATRMYEMGDVHVDRVAAKCEDKKQVTTPEIEAKRDAMSARLEKIAHRYRFLPVTKKSDS